MERTFLLPGEMAFAKEPTEISTVLGSCVAICLHDGRRSWGGMNHYMLPDGNSGMAPGKCGDQAIPQLLRLAELAGSRLADLSAAVYGGGAVVGHLGSAGFDIGTRNIETARRLLAERGLRIARAEIGGQQGRRIAFDTATGAVQVRLIQQTAQTQAQADLEGRLRERPARVLVVDDSATVRRIIAAALQGAEGLELCGEAEDPFQARERIMDCDPDVICLDIIMPRLDGLSFLRRIMQYKPIPVVIVSTIAKQGSEMRAKVEAAGAVAVFDKEQLAIHQGFDRLRAELLPALRRAARTVVQKREAP